MKISAGTALLFIFLIVKAPKWRLLVLLNENKHRNGAFTYLFYSKSAEMALIDITLRK